MTILQIVPSVEPERGGPSRSVPRLAAALSEAGAQVSLLATGPEGVSNATVFPRSYPAFLCASKELRRHLASQTAEIVHHHSVWLRTLHYAACHSRRSGVPLVISPRGMFSEWALRHHGLRKKLAATFVHPGAFRNAAGWHATSPDEAAEIRRAGFRQPVCVSPNGIDPVPPADLDSARRDWARRLPDDGCRTALFYSRFHRKKRVLELIDLWAARAPSGWRLLIVGIEEEYSTGFLRDQIRRAGPAANIFVYPGNESPFPPYAAADLFLLPSHSENFGMVIGEALAAGLPVLVSDGTPWSGVAANECGWCVPWEDFSKTLETLARLPDDELKALGENGRKWIEAEYSWERSAGVLLDFYRSLR